MNGKQRFSFLSIFRRDRIAGVWLALLLLIVPFIQPLSEANAADKPFAAMICSTFGIAGKAVLPGLADDCPACISGQHTTQFTIFDGTLAAVTLPQLQLLRSADFLPPPVLPSAVSRWKMKPPGHAPPFSI